MCSIDDNLSLMIIYIYAIMIGIDSIYYRVSDGTTKLVYDILSYEILYLCRKMSTYIISMFVGSYDKFWMSYNSFGED